MQYPIDMTAKNAYYFNMKPDHIPRIAVVGGGPAGAFFALTLKQKAKLAGRSFDVVILEGKRDLEDDKFPALLCNKEGCNYCAGGLSPRLVDALQDLDITLPEEIILDKIKSLTIQGHWKNIVLSVPDERKMFTVFRGSRPQARRDTCTNFDSFLLHQAERTGARLLTAELVDVTYDADSRPVITYVTKSTMAVEKMTCDFVVLAGGVNQIQGAELDKQSLFKLVQRIIPRYQPPKVRKTLIFELEISGENSLAMEGEIYFVEFGSKEFKIDMASLIPKGKFITAVLIGPAIDRFQDYNKLDIIKQYLEMPQIKRILPPNVKISPVCICSPNMTVGAAKNPFGHRIALIGDMVISRLYKDGIYSAYLTASALANALLKADPKFANLKKYYHPPIKKFRRDNAFGRIVFMLNRIVFMNPTWSRIFYQAVLTERKSKSRSEQWLAKILWGIASGDDTYRNSLIAMFHPRTLWLVFFGGILVTLRNYLTEQIFGLKWHGFGRYPTGLHKEDFEEKKKEFLRTAGLSLTADFEFESMYSIQIKAQKGKIVKFLGKFGDEDMPYFRPRLIKVQRTVGSGNELNSVIRYRTPLNLFDFDIRLQTVLADNYFIYRVLNGFAKGGVLIFNIETINKNIYSLYIYVGFNFAQGRGCWQKIWNKMLKIFFPGYMHDVLWNHSLCKLKECVETR